MVKTTPFQVAENISTFPGLVASIGLHHILFEIDFYCYSASILLRICHVGIAASCLYHAGREFLLRIHPLV